MEKQRKNGLSAEQRKSIGALRCEGMGYHAIAKRLDISVDAVKGHCRRYGLTSEADLSKYGICRQCGNPVEQNEGRKEKKFCSEACRRAWWKEYPLLIKRKAYYPIVCAGCGKEFLSYGKKDRKYCCRACYYQTRFGTPADDGGAV